MNRQAIFEFLDADGEFDRKVSRKQRKKSYSNAKEFTRLPDAIGRSDAADADLTKLPNKPIHPNKNSYFAVPNANSPHSAAAEKRTVARDQLDEFCSSFWCNRVWTFIRLVRSETFDFCIKRFVCHWITCY